MSTDGNPFFSRPITMWISPVAYIGYCSRSMKNDHMSTSESIHVCAIALLAGEDEEELDGEETGKGWLWERGRLGEFT